MSGDPFVDRLMTRLRTTEAMIAAVAHIEVSACPFCGSPGALERVIDDIWHVSCTDHAACCGAGPIRPSAEDAARAWNRRLLPVSEWDRTGQ